MESGVLELCNPPHAYKKVILSTTFLDPLDESKEFSVSNLIDDEMLSSKLLKILPNQPKQPSILMCSTNLDEVIFKSKA